MWNLDTNSKEVISGAVAGDESKTPLELVLACLDRFDDVAAKSEATRILTNLIKSVWLHQGNNMIKESTWVHVLIWFFDYAQATKDRPL